MKFDRTKKKISHRDWVTLSEVWKKEEIQFDIGAAPDPSLQDLLDINNEDLTLGGTQKEIELKIPGIRQCVLREGFYLIRKSLALLRSSYRDACAGQYTIPGYLAYQSAIFAAKALMSFLGVSWTYRAINGKHWIVDSFHLPKAQKRPTIAPHAIESPRLEHKEMWATLKRVVNVTDSAPFDPGFAGLLFELDAAQISRPRNYFQYRAEFWAFPLDIQGDSIDPPFEIRSFDESIYTKLDVEDMNGPFMHYFVLILLRQSILLMRGVGDEVQYVSGEIELALNAFPPICEHYDIAGWTDLPT